MPGKHKGFKMEPQGAYKKYKDSKGFNKYGLMDPNEVTPTMKVKHLAGTEREHVHKERPAHSDTPEAHGPMMAGQTAGQIVRRERLMVKYGDNTMKKQYNDIPNYKSARNGSLMRKDYMLQASAAEKAAAKAKAVDGGMPENVANKVFKKDYKMGDVKGSPSQDQQANKMSQMSYTDDYANKSLKQLVSDEKAIHSGKFNLSTNPDGKNKKGQDNYGDIQDRRHKNKNVVRAYRDQQQNVNRGRDSLGNPITKKYKK